MSSPQARFTALPDARPLPPKAGGVYIPCLVVDNLIYVSGHLPYLPDGTTLRGCVGHDLTPEQSHQAARQAGLCILATLENHLGSLDKIKRVVKVLGMLRTTPDFEQHAQVMNGCSELFREIWGDELGVGVRSSVGMGSLPRGVPVEIEAVFELAH